MEEFTGMYRKLCKITSDGKDLKKYSNILTSVTTLHSYNRLYKLIDELARQRGGLQEHLSIDESMAPYYGKPYAKQ